MALDPRQAMILGADPARAGVAGAQETDQLARHRTQASRALLTANNLRDNQVLMQWGPSQRLYIPKDSWVEVYIEGNVLYNVGPPAGQGAICHIGWDHGLGTEAVIDLVELVGATAPTSFKTAPNSPKGNNGAGSFLSGLGGPIVLSSTSSIYNPAGSIPEGEHDFAITWSVTAVTVDATLVSARGFLRVGL